MRLKNKVAIVTGSSGGIGYAVAEGYLKEGAKVAIIGLTDETVKKAVNELKKTYSSENIFGIKVDVRNTDEVNKMADSVFKKWGHIDILVNNAGICHTKSILETTDEEYENVLNVNTTGTFRCIRAVAKYMIKTGGSIINTSSMVGLYGGIYQTAYTASKYAINGITETCAKELGRYKIRVNAVAPGIIKTDMVKENVSAEVENKLVQMAPLGRVGIPTDLQGIYTYLASDEAMYTTGTIVSVDGGLIM